MIVRVNDQNISSWKKKASREKWEEEKSDRELRAMRRSEDEGFWEELWDGLVSLRAIGCSRDDNLDIIFDVAIAGNNTTFFLLLLLPLHFGRLFSLLCNIISFALSSRVLRPKPYFGP